ncbi:uncharacterized protein LOC109858793 [Pseudomyrmex gracilis]|uniref:uncharacterized protein LOC109858793 n=1 Tax=Pseudomyrmex gracilis TaxID=219809 RepID=UPI000995100C|nr:uncharacterized protein LOC109858793 [Pseudomyrmex gracilis]
MSLCFRTLSIVNGQKPLSKLDRHQLREHVESSVFLKRFLGGQRALSIRANTEKELSLPLIDSTLHSNFLLLSLDTHNYWNEKQIRQYDKNKNTTYWLQTPRRLHNKTQRLTVVFLKNKKHLATTDTTSNNVTVFKTQNGNNNLSVHNSSIISSESLYSSQNSSKNISFTSDDDILRTNSQLSQPRDNDHKPSEDQLQRVVDCLSQDLPKLFVKPHDYSIYTKDILFINNIRGITTRGISNYAKQLILIRTIGHLKYAHVKLHVLKITKHPEDGTVKVRWRICGISSWKVFVMFWKFRIFKIHEAINRDSEVWYDGFSTYYLNGDGKVYKHVADKIMPDQDVVAKKEDLSIAPKLAIFTSLTNILDNKNFFELNFNSKLHQLKEVTHQ